MKDFSSMTFTITNITTERRINGITTIYFIPNDGVDYGHEFNITTTGGLENMSKDMLRQSLVEWYKRFKDREDVGIVKVGDII